MKILWDGSYLGDVTDDIILRDEDKGYNLIKFKNGSVGYITPFKDNIPLILDELKPLFSLRKIGRHSCRIENKKYILHKISRGLRHEYPCSNHISLYKHYNEKVIIDIRRSLMFRYIMGLVKNVESSLWIRIRGNAENYVTSYNERTINYETSILTDPLIERIFESWDVAVSTLKDMISEKDFKNEIIRLRWSITETINRIDNNYVYLTNSILRRIDEIV
jgi:hypothetical protein